MISVVVVVLIRLTILRLMTLLERLLKVVNTDQKCSKLVSLDSSRLEDSSRTTFINIELLDSPSEATKCFYGTSPSHAKSCESQMTNIGVCFSSLRKQAQRGASWEFSNW